MQLQRLDFTPITRPSLDPREDTLICSPEPRLFPGTACGRTLIASFLRGDAHGILHLAGSTLREELSPPLTWAREWGCRFLACLCQHRDPTALPPPTPQEREQFVGSAPPLPGAEYLTPELAERLWKDLIQIAAEESAIHPDGLTGWLREHSPVWHLVGRVTLHLAENKRNQEKPFAFLATYTDQVSSGGKVQHLPLGRAMQTYAAQKTQTVLDALLHPVRTAADRSPLLRELLESRKLFQALAWSPDDAFRFLREIPVLEESGLVVKVPDWWKQRRPSRPQVSVTIDSPKKQTLGLDAMLAFQTSFTLNGQPLTPEEQRQIRSAASGLINLRGEWIEIDRERLDSVLEHWTQIQAAHKNGVVTFHEGMRWLAGYPNAAFQRGSGGTHDFALSLDWSQIIAGPNFASALSKLRTEDYTSDPPGLKAALRPYQKRGVAWMWSLTSLGLGACLADDMGLGKTVQVIALLCLRRGASASGSLPCLIVVPASLMGNWSQELRRFAPHLRVFTGHSGYAPKEAMQLLSQSPSKALSEYDALLTTYGLLQRSEPLLNTEWDLAILDEAQAIKNPATTQARSVKTLKTKARLALTGTPVENRLGDLWSLFDFLNPGLLGRAQDFAQATQKMAKSPAGYAPLRKLTAPYLLRRLKTDRTILPDLPEKTEVTAHCPLTRKQSLLYAKLVEQLKADLAAPDLDVKHRRGLVISYLTRFKQVCNHPSHWSGDGRFTPADSGKFLRLTELATEFSERQERCLVFTQFREITEPIASHLSQIFGRQGLILNGATPVKKRPQLVEQFQRPDGPPFFVLTVKAGGTGLTLTAASHVIHFDRWWNPAVENQATDRAFRIGQKRNVLVHKFVSPGTIEEKVDALLSQKGALATELLSGEGGAQRLLTELSDNELLNLVRLDIHTSGG